MSKNFRFDKKTNLEQISKEISAQYTPNLAQFGQEEAQNWQSITHIYLTLPTHPIFGLRSQSFTFFDPTAPINSLYPRYKPNFNLIPNIPNLSPKFPQQPHHSSKPSAAATQPKLGGVNSSESSMVRLSIPPPSHPIHNNF